MILSSIFMIYPILLFNLFISSYDARIAIRFVGLGNYVRMFQDTIFHKALFNNFVFFDFSSANHGVFRTFTSFCVEYTKTSWTNFFFKLALFLPSVTSLVSYAVLFKMMFQIGGIINRGLLAIGIIQQPLDWLNSPFGRK